MLCLYVYNVLPPQRLPGSFEDSLCNGQRKIKETRFKKKKKKKKEFNVLGNEKLLNNIKPVKASGPDLVPARILKLTSKETAPVLCVAFQQSYNTGQGPQDWQHANITAVFKKGDKTNPSELQTSLTYLYCL